ncbi:TIGR04282 family arsenosugar biosynthesis glycosyltransferase [Crenalkalicoccus roseus]|uniref:TIGR04282 family arsenosugar biosynthesis glycosyltransferase n=1 Tax=Crenalkalicoccus roseus TaxID=1485588 RepID=UPI0010816B54|nr:TIGR04282 family arsenosugar biosynthesis glycosyltransferase [Crenalkalicoccus roseus]
MRGDTLILFARAPRLGAVKRRLARGIGALAALRFYRTQLAALCRRLGRDRRWRTVLAVTPDHARARWPAPLPRLPQGRGDLGARMRRALFRHRRAVLVGSDIPGLGAEDIAAAFRALGRAEAVFGPAEDGGYWLVGLGPRRPARPFAGVRWSTEHALADTLANFRHRRVVLLRRLRDVDTAADLAALRPSGARPGRPPPAIRPTRTARDP